MTGNAVLNLIGHNANGTVVALATLVQMLEQRGALEKGAYLRALKGTFSDPAADFERPDYMLLQHLARFLEGHFDDPWSTH
jgi:hypothetical protein